ncbi:MAG: SPOR domain-containing protein [Bdellovibrionota bacterium]
MEKKYLYYIGVPALSVAMCGVSFYLGQERGKQLANIEKLKDAFDVFDSQMAPAEDTELTFYETLHSDQKPDQIAKLIGQSTSEKNSQSNKNQEANESTLPVASKGSRESVPVSKPATTVSRAESTQREDSKSSNSDQWIIQMGAFKDIGKAHELTDRLKNMGFDTVTDTSSSASGQLFKVVVRAKNKDDAQTLLTKLQKDGFGQAFVKKIQ